MVQVWNWWWVRIVWSPCPYRDEESGDSVGECCPPREQIRGQGGTSPHRSGRDLSVRNKTEGWAAEGPQVTEKKVKCHHKLIYNIINYVEVNMYKG